MSMLVQTLSGEEYEWKLSERIVKGNNRKTSKGHSLAKRIIRDIYPACRIYEEIPVILEISGRKKSEVFLDFFIPSLTLAIEVQGEQHYTFNSFFYKTKLDFLKAQQRDKNKALWCELNGIKLVVLPHFENEEQWKARLMNS